MEDREIVALYFARCEAAISETDKKYGRYCRYIARNILGDDGDAEEVTDDTYVKLWNSIPPSKPDPLKPYIGTVARRLAINRYEARGAKKRSAEVELVLEELAECIPDGSEDLGESLALRDALNRFVGALSERERRIFLRRYWYASSISEIARDFLIKEDNAAILLFRIRKKLRLFLEKEGYDL